MQTIESMNFTSKEKIKNSVSYQGGWGVGVKMENKKRIRMQESGCKERKFGAEVVRIGDWRVVIGASFLRLLLLCAPGCK